MIILTDTREQKPYCFENYPDVQVEAGTLATGDYSIPGFDDQVAIERKSLNDLIGCLKGDGRTRFEKELARARHYHLFCVVIEAGFHHIGMKRYHSAMTPQAIFQSLAAFHVRYGIPFLFCGDRDGGQYQTYSLLSKFAYEIEKRFKQLTII
jgi:DNA excision repair protein ERCC-4